jgi:hypothetical protein
MRQDSNISSEVIIIGTIHKPWNKDFLSEDIEKIVIGLSPAAILMEISPFSLMPGTENIFATISQKGCISRHILKDEGNRDSQEYFAVDRASRQLGIQVHPIDIENLALYFRQNKPITRERKIREMIEKIIKYLGTKKDSASAISNSIGLQLIREINTMGDNLMRCASPEVLNSQSFDDLRRSFFHLYGDLLPAICSQYRRFIDKQYPGFEQFMEDHNACVGFWREREETMAANIARLAGKYQGQRLAVVVGNFHRARLRDLLTKEPNIILREFWEMALK